MEAAARLRAVFPSEAQAGLDESGALGGGCVWSAWAGASRGGAGAEALAGLAGTSVRQAVRPLVALYANVGRDPLDEDKPVLECAVVEFSHSISERAVGFWVFGVW